MKVVTLNLIFYCNGLFFYFVLVCLFILFWFVCFFLFLFCLFFCFLFLFCFCFVFFFFFCFFFFFFLFFFFFFVYRFFFFIYVVLKEMQKLSGTTILHVLGSLCKSVLTRMSKLVDVLFKIISLNYHELRFKG